MATWRNSAAHDGREGCATPQASSLLSIKLTGHSAKNLGHLTAFFPPWVATRLEARLNMFFQQRHQVLDHALQLIWLVLMGRATPRPTSLLNIRNPEHLRAFPACSELILYFLPLV